MIARSGRDARAGTHASGYEPRRLPRGREAARCAGRSEGTPHATEKRPGSARNDEQREGGKGACRSSIAGQRRGTARTLDSPTTFSVPGALTRALTMAAQSECLDGSDQLIAAPGNLRPRGTTSRGAPAKSSFLTVSGSRKAQVVVSIYRVRWLRIPSPAR